MRLTPEMVAARAEILEQLYRYCRGVDRKDWAMIRACYHPGAIDDHGGAARTVDDFIGWLNHRHQVIVQSFHAVMNVLYVHQGPTCVHTESYAIADQLSTRNPGFRRSVGCRYLDRFELRDDAWRIAHRQVVYEWIELRAIAVDELDRNSRGAARRDESDASFAHLAPRRP